MRKLSVLLFVLCFAIILTGCDLFGSDESIDAQNDIVVINFDSHSAKGMSLNTQYPKVAELYWSYTAEKKDNKPKYGEKLAPANIKDGTGCDKNIEFSTGKWEFVLYGFTTADARTQSNTVELAEKNCTYTGKVEKELKKTDTAVTVYTAVNSNPDTYGTIKVSVTTSPTNSNKTVKYYITNANGYSTTWTSISGQENTSATDGYTVYLGLFDETGRNVGETSITNIRVDAGLTTEISGTWDVNFIEGGIDIIGPWNVKFESVLGKPVQNQSVKNGECATMPSDLTLGEKIRGVIGTIDAIYEFAGWAETENGPVVDIEAIHITADKTFYAVWTKVSDAPNVWNVKFETRIPNHVIPNKLVTDGNCAETPSDFTVGKLYEVQGNKVGIFCGWTADSNALPTSVDYDFSEPITTDTTLYAKWNEVNIVSFDVQGHGTKINSQNVENGGKVTKPADPTTTGFVCKGWYKESACINEWNFDTDTVTSSITLYAKWVPEVYTITYKDKGGTDFSGTTETDTPSTHTYGSTTTLKGATKPGYTFGGWCTDIDCNLTSITSIGATEYTTNLTLYAKWVPEVYTITYKDKGGADFSGNNLDSLPQTHTYNSATNLIPATTTTDGIMFEGWYKNSDCSDTPVTSIGATEYTTNFTLYAKWEQITAYKITKSGSEYSYYITCDTNPTSLSGFSISATQEEAEKAIGTATPVFGEAGGYVFYILTSGTDGYNGQYTSCTYLEASAEDVGSYAFGYYRLSVKSVNLFVNGKTKYNEADCTGTKIGTGKRNTTLLTDVMGDEAYLGADDYTEGLYAAKACFEYSSGAYNDWFLPSIDELEQMYINLYSKNVGNFIKKYWSSSEDSVNTFTAWGWDFRNGDSDRHPRIDHLSVRACRAF